MGAARSHPVGWTLSLGNSQILTIQTIWTLPRPSTSHSQTPARRRWCCTCLARSILQQETAQQRGANTPSQVSQTCGSRGEARKLMAQPKISHALAEQLLSSRELRTDEHFPTHASHHTLAGPLKRVLQLPVWCCQRWVTADTAEVSVRRIWRVSTQSDARRAFGSALAFLP